MKVCWDDMSTSEDAPWLTRVVELHQAEPHQVFYQAPFCPRGSILAPFFLVSTTKSSHQSPLLKNNLIIALAATTVIRLLALRGLY